MAGKQKKSNSTYLVGLDHAFSRLYIQTQDLEVFLYSHSPILECLLNKRNTCMFAFSSVSSI